MSLIPAMYDNISVIIPTYNERESISDIISTVFKEVSRLEEIIVVDDDSPDMTWQLVKELGKGNGKIRLIRRQGKRGLPVAIWEGILNSKGKRVLWLDADFFSLPHTLTELSTKADGYDIVVASRYVKGARDSRVEKARVITSRIFNQLARFILSSRTQDLTSGYIIARKEIFNNLNLKGIYGEYCVRFLYEAERNNLKIKEVPYVCLSRQKGRSKTYGNPLIFIKHCLIYLFTVFQLRFSKNGAQS